jgi:hypothetical protein
MNPHFRDLREACQCYQNAYKRLKPPDADIYFEKPTGRDYAWEDLQTLGRMLKKAGCDLASLERATSQSAMR